MTNSTPNTSSTPLTDILFGTLTVLFAKGFCLGRAYSVGRTQCATGETRLAVLNLQGSPVFEVAFRDGGCVGLDAEFGDYEADPNEVLFEAARQFAKLEATLPLGIGDDVVPQYSPDHPSFPVRS